MSSLNYLFFFLARLRPRHDGLEILKVEYFLKILINLNLSNSRFES